MADESTAPTIPNDAYREEYTKEFADHWDDLIGWEGRAKGEGKFFQRLLAANGSETVADIACGTGFHAINLAREGFQVTATDGADTMLRKTKDNAERLGVPLQAYKLADWLELSKVLGENQFDGMICLGNAFSHLFEHEARRDALREFYKATKPGGMFVVDHRNYDSMLDNGYSSKHQYYYTGKGVDVEPVVLNRYLAHFEYTFPDKNKFHLKLYPLRQDYMSHLLEDAGFINVERYGDFEKPYNSEDVDFIQQVAYKPRD